jgi:hypothetical protein
MAEERAAVRSAREEGDVLPIGPWAAQEDETDEADA